MSPSLVTIGESMVLLGLPDHGRLHGAPTPMILSVGGAESNVAIAASRTGVASTWIGKLGDDDFGSLVARELTGAGIRVLAPRDPAAVTGFMVKEHRRGQPSHVRYYRQGSAASTLDPEGLPDAEIAAADLLHLTGITPALGEGPERAVHVAIALARSAGTSISLDINYRSSLWSPARARATLSPLLPYVDLVFASLDEAYVITEGSTAVPPGDLWQQAADVAATLAATGVDHVVIKLGVDGALSWNHGTVTTVTATTVTVVDTVGAGDAFVGGYLGTWLHGADPAECLKVGADLGAAACSAAGDWVGVLDFVPGRPLTGGPDVRR